MVFEDLSKHPSCFKIIELDRTEFNTVVVTDWEQKIPLLDIGETCETTRDIYRNSEGLATVLASSSIYFRHTVQS